MLKAAAQSTVAAIVAFAVRKPAAVLATYLILLGAALFAAANHLEINTDSRGMLNLELPFQKRTVALEDNFPHLLNTVIVMVESKVPDAADAVAASLVNTLPGQDGIASVFAESVSPFFLTHGPLYEDVATLESALTRLDANADLLAAVRETPTADALFASLAFVNRQASGDPAATGPLDQLYGNIAAVLDARAAGEASALSWQNLLTDDSTAGTGESLTTRLVQVMPVLDYTELQPAETALNSIRVAIDALPSTVGETSASLVSVSVTGEPILMFEELEAVADGIGLSMGASMIVVVILLIICYASIRRTVVTLVSIVIALCLALGFAAVALGPLNLVSIAFVVPLVGLGLDFAIHVTTRAAELERSGRSAKEAFIGTGRAIALALALSAFTTAAAFLSFVGTDFVGMGQVGILGAVGVFIAFLISLTLVPALSTMGGGDKVVAATATPQARQAAQAPSATGNQLRKAATGVLVVLALGAIFVAPDVRFDTDPTNLRDPESPSMVSLATLMADPELAPYRLSLAGSRETIASFAESADGASEVDTVITLARLVPDDQARKVALFTQRYPSIVDRTFGASRLPIETDDAAAQLATELSARHTGPGAERLRDVLTERADAMDSAELDGALMAYLPQLLDRLRAQADLASFTEDDLPALVRERFVTEAGTYRAEVAPAFDLRDPDNRRRFVEQIEAINAGVAGAPLEIDRAGQVVSAAMVQATLIAAVVVTLMCLVVLRSVRETLAVLIPLVIAGLLVVGTMALLDLPFNYANVIVLPLIIGLGVDSSIHLAVRKREVESGSVYATSTPRAVLFSGLTTAVAFVSLALSSHRGTASMGELLGLSIAIVLVTTIVATPTILDLLKPKQSKSA